MTGAVKNSDNQSRGAANRAHRDNHRLPLREGVATPAHLAATEEALGILLRRAQHAAISDAIKRGGFASRLMVDLGRDAKQLVQLHRIHCEADSAKPPLDWGLVSWSSGNGIKYGWWLPAGVDVDHKRQDGGEKDRGTIWLPVLERTESWLAMMGCLKIGDARALLDGSEAQIKHDIAAFRSWARTTLGPLGSALPRVKRMRGALAEQLMWQQNGDWALANQLSGRDMKRSPARSGYTSLATPRAARLYASAMPNPISELSLAPANVDDEPHRLVLPGFAQSSGALTRQHSKGDPDTMATMVSMLCTKPDHRHRSNIGKVIADHNDFATKVWILLALGMAIRRLTNWVPGLQLIEPRSGGLVVLDKDLGSDEAPDKVRSEAPGAMLGRARMVFLHPSVRRVLEAYIEQLRKLGLRSDVDETSKALIARHVTGLEGDALLPLLELKKSSEEGMIAADEVPPAWIAERLKGLADVPENFARHTLRSGLVGLIPENAINALLGHFDQGTEPWTNGSAFDPAAYRALVSASFEAHFVAAAELTKPSGQASE
jgi:hypothetical protein